MPLSVIRCPMEEDINQPATFGLERVVYAPKIKHVQVSNAGIGIKKGGSSSSLYVTPAKVSPVVPSICIHNLATTQAKPFKITIPLTSSQESQDANSQLTHLLIGVGTTPFTCRSHGNDSFQDRRFFLQL